MDLTTGECLVFSTRLSRKMFFMPFLASIVVGTCALVMGASSPQNASAVALGFAALMAILWVPRIADYVLTKFVVTNKRLVIRQGILTRRSYEMLIQKIETVDVFQSIVDRLWGAGTLMITGTGGSTESFRNVGGARAFQAGLNELLHSR